MSGTELAAIIHDARIEIYALVLDGRDEGLLELDFREPGQCELVYFGVTAGLIGTGAARFLMNRALERAWTRPTCAASGCAPTPSTTRRPLAFYQRSGFIPFRRQIEVADDPRLDGTASRTAAKHVPIIA